MFVIQFFIGFLTDYSILLSKMVHYTFEEYRDMIMCYGEARSNSYEAQRIYRERYPLRQVPNVRTFIDVHRRLGEDGCFRKPKVNSGVSRTRRTVRNEETVLRMVENNPRTSTRKTSSAVRNLNRESVRQIFNEQLLRPYHFQKIHSLLEHDFFPRVQFCEWLQNQRQNIILSILFTDEAGFSRDGILNLHNMHHWSDENPHQTVIRSHQYGFSINVWAGIIDNYLIGPFRLPNRLTGALYRNFLENDLNTLLEDVPLAIIGRMYYMHDGAPAHFSRVAREYLDRRFGNTWIGRGGPVPWPARSPDLNPLDFSFWGFMKNEVYAVEIHNEEQLWIRIMESADRFRNNPGIFQRCRQSLRRRMEKCIEVQGQQFEHLLKT